MDEPIHYVSAESLETLKQEREKLKNVTIPEIAKRIDEAKQQGDLSENAEYTQAREDMSWAQSRLIELDQIINNSQVIEHKATGIISVGSKITVKVNGQTKEYIIVGPQEINPAKGYISNESPLGEAFIGHKIGDKVEVNVPSGIVEYEVLTLE